MALKILNAVALATLLLHLSACNSSDEKAVADSGNKQVKPLSTLDAPTGNSGSNGILGSSDATAVVPAAVVDFDVFVYGNANNRQICLGRALITINTDFSLAFPDSKLTCASIVIDLSKILAQAQSSGTDGLAGNMTHDGMVLSAEKLMNATFTPARPVMLGPIITDRDKYKDYVKSVATSVDAISLETGASIKGKGTVELRTIDFNAYTNEIVGSSFDSILHWRASTTGFEGVPKTLGLLFERIDWWFNTKPIMIPKIEIVADIGDFLEKNALSSMVGKVRIVLQVNNYVLK